MGVLGEEATLFLWDGGGEWWGGAGLRGSDGIESLFFDGIQLSLFSGFRTQGYSPPGKVASFHDGILLLSQQLLRGHVDSTMATLSPLQKKVKPVPLLRGQSHILGDSAPWMCKVTPAMEPGSAVSI